MTKKNPTAHYTPDERAIFVKTAENIGVVAAMRNLGYPRNKNTAYKWAKQKGINLEMDVIRENATNMGSFFGRAEKTLVIQKHLERMYQIIAGEDLSPIQHERMSKAINQCIQTLNLVNGEATTRTENVKLDKADKMVNNLMKDMENL